MLAINEAYHGVCFVFFFQYYGDLPDLHSFPTRRSSDLEQLVTLPIDAVSHNRTIDYAVEIHVRAVGDIPGFFFEPRGRGPASPTLEWGTGQCRAFPACDGREAGRS